MSNRVLGNRIKILVLGAGEQNSNTYKLFIHKAHFLHCHTYTCTSTLDKSDGRVLVVLTCPVCTAQECSEDDGTVSPHHYVGYLQKV